MDRALKTSPIWEISAALLILGWRCLAYPLAHAWRDWIVVLAIFWIFTVFASRSRTWPIIAVGTMALLLGIYLIGNFSVTVGWLEHQH